MQQFSGSLPMMLYAALDKVMPRFRSIFRTFGLTEQQWRVLRVLWERKQIGLGELSEITLVSPPSLVGVIDRIIAMGLITKQRSESDRRAVSVKLTAKGQVLESKVMPQVNAAYAELQASVDVAVWDGLISGLNALGAKPDTLPDKINESTRAVNA